MEFDHGMSGSVWNGSPSGVVLSFFYQMLLIYFLLIWKSQCLEVISKPQTLSLSSIPTFHGGQMMLGPIPACKWLLIYSVQFIATLSYYSYLFLDFPFSHADVIFYGQTWTSADFDRVATFFNGISSTPWFGIIKQYTNAQGQAPQGPVYLGASVQDFSFGPR